MPSEELTVEGEMGSGRLGREVSTPRHLVEKVIEIYTEIAKLESLKPSKPVNALFTHLVHICTLPISFDMDSLENDIKDVRSKLVCLCAEAESQLEAHFSDLIGRCPRPISSLHIFPYYSNYLKLAVLEFETLVANHIPMPKNVAFLGSGPMPLSSIVLALHHMPTTLFDNYDISPHANLMGSSLMRGHADLLGRMSFHTCDAKMVKGDAVAEYDMVILAALVGVIREEKAQIIAHLAAHMKQGATLLVRSAHGSRSFLYPVVEEEDLSGFSVMDVVHPTNEVINSIILAKKICN
ncbi:nicotianamine synthase [Amborella trichopoda]|uniref:Nicotianamine synthase n=1 Tax=Amborella trichopoda TaxID=13333 RepID=W1PFJ9_AMBTC|nr:nicotianamine synthase [Amborella trichopoda]ERN06494.1 hypothetical protein AMTR_s00058p00051350 [Amborella trichopoda]|eukprot:XP_006844819.1 nicotianamine synthase [Amborella trichopoda]